MKKLLALAVLVAGAGLGVWNLIHTPFQGFSEPVMLEFPKGTSSRQMGEALAAKGVIRASGLWLAARAFERGQRLQAGEYRFEKPASVLDVYRRIARGDIFYMELLVPEGHTIWDTADLVAQLGTIKRDDFLAAARDPALIRDLDPAATSLEGYLFPNKYRVYRHTTARDLCRMMTGEFRSRWQALGSAAKPHDAVTLASLVEREAKRKEEQPLVSSVFHNRLKIGMRLDCDPTTIYAAILEGHYSGTIHRSDLESENPYNTYKHAGL